MVWSRAVVGGSVAKRSGWHGQEGGGWHWSRNVGGAMVKGGRQWHGQVK